ncbi:MAG: transposase [Candidatus Aminicenantes bacterium]|nr:transposase [Candidatus Aminicenantes bacterium]
MYLVVLKVRKGGYVPFFMTERNRFQMALLSLGYEALVNRVSTRKVEQLTRSLGIGGI